MRIAAKFFARTAAHALRYGLFFSVAAWVPSCSSDEPVKGQLMLAVQADMPIPKDVDSIRLEIRAYGNLLLGEDYPLGPPGLVIPATLAILSGKDPSTPVSIRLISRYEGKVRTLRDVITTVPPDRIAMLRLPIQWLCDGFVTERDGQLESTCPEGQTCDAGECVGVEVDSSTLEDYSPEAIYGGGSEPGEGECFDTVACFSSGASVDVEFSACSIAEPVPAGKGTNVALQFAPESAGICGSNACWIPLDAPSSEGWRPEGGRIMLPKAVCEQISNGKVSGVAVTTSCETKTSSIPLCGPWYTKPVEPDPDPSNSCLPPKGTSGQASIEAGSPVVLATMSNQAMNLAGLSSGLTKKQQLSALAVGVGDCESAGVLRTDSGEAGNARLVFHDLSNLPHQTPTQAEFITDEFVSSENAASLLYASDCTPTVMQPTNQGYRQFHRSEAGVWEATEVELVEGGNVYGVQTLGAWQRSDGTMKLIATAMVAGDTKGFLGQRAGDAESSWTFTPFEIPSVTALYSIKEDSHGTLHMVYNDREFECDPCDMNLYHGIRSSDGKWSKAIVQQGKWGAPNDEYAEDAVLGFDSSGQPFIVATYLVRAMTGSIIAAEPRLYGRKQSEWCHDTMTTEAAGFSGADGKKMTGIAPMLVFDVSDRPHIVFMDKAQWHDDTGWANAVDGQVRYAVRNGTKWTLQTLLAQKAAEKNQKPLVGAMPPLLAVSPDGTSIHAVTATYEWDTDSIYLQNSADVTLRTTAIHALVTHP